MDESPQATGHGLVSPVDRHVGTRLQARRLELGMALPQISDSLGVSVYEVERWEAGLTRVPPEYLLPFAERLGVPVSALFEQLPVVTELPLSVGTWFKGAGRGL